MPLGELKKHIYALPFMPDAIPYITSYYKESWGFCMSHDEFCSLEEGEYEVVIDSKLFDGVMNYGELIIGGKSETEVLISTYICHPSLANNEVSDPSVATYLADWIASKERMPAAHFLPLISPRCFGCSPNHRFTYCKNLSSYTYQP